MWIMGRKKNKKYKKAILNLILYIILLSILIYSGIKIFKWYKDKTNNNKKNEYENRIRKLSKKSYSQRF